MFSNIAHVQIIRYYRLQNPQTPLLQHFSKKLFTNISLFLFRMKSDIVPCQNRSYVHVLHCLRVTALAIRVYSHFRQPSKLLFRLFTKIAYENIRKS
jgi:hypothetical protein